jgi:hypothetical protein
LDRVTPIIEMNMMPVAMDAGRPFTTTKRGSC